jgi:hypothetical protein
MVIDLAEWRMRMRTAPTARATPAPSVTAAMLRRSSYEASLDLFNGVSFADRLLQEARNFGGVTGEAALRTDLPDEHAGPHRGSFHAVMDLWHGPKPRQPASTASGPAGVPHG